MRIREIALAAFFLAANSCYGQTLVSGTVADGNSSPYSNAIMEVKNSTGRVVPYFTLTTAGTFQITLPTGTYTFTASFAGVAEPIGTGPQVCAASSVSVSGSTQTVTFSGCPTLLNGAGGASPGGSTNSVQTQATSSTLGGDSNFTYSTATGLLSHVNAGVFTSTQMNEYSAFSVGTSCSPNNIINFGGNTYNVTDAASGCARVPSSGVSNAWSSGVGAYCQNDNASTNSSQFGGPNQCVGILGDSYCTVSNGQCYGGNVAAGDKSGNTNNGIKGFEVDISINNNSSTGFGYVASFRGNGQPTGYTFPAFQIQTPTGSGTFSDGIQFQDGSLATGADSIYRALRLGQAIAGTGRSNSQSIQWNAHDASAAISAYRQLSQDDIVFDVGYPTTQYNPSGDGMEGYGITLTSTNTLAVHQLVKIDTAHASSVVVCTTSDTSCDAFIGEGSNSGSGSLCTAASPACPLITAPGSKALGILGTGTCTIGQYVIVDTTTNGDIQCTGTPPTIGKEIGKALSAQSTVGQTVYVLTKFE